MTQLLRFINTSGASFQLHLQHPQMRELFTMAEAYSETMSAVIAMPVKGNPVPQLLFQVSTTTYMCAFHLAFSGQTSAVHATSRAALEAALYGFVVSRSDENYERWKNPPRDSRMKVRASEAFKLLDQEGIEEYREIKAAYEDLISLGAHPNRLAVAYNTRSTPNEQGSELEFTAIYPPSTSSVRQIANAISTAALSMIVAGTTFADSRDQLIVEGRGLHKRLLDYLRANSDPLPPAFADTSGTD